MQHAAIIDRGRGPQIAGTRITVYDIMDYLKMNWHHTAIAAWLRISSYQVLAAIDYIETHRAEVEAEYRRILEREVRGNPPEVQAKVDAIHARYAPLWEELKRRAREKENGDAGSPGGQECLLHLP
jgi:uncharacterized protein (DUF433 family)